MEASLSTTDVQFPQKETYLYFSIWNLHIQETERKSYEKLAPPQLSSVLTVHKTWPPVTHSHLISLIET